MRLKFVSVVLAAVLTAGCMLAVTNKPQTPGSSMGSSLTYAPAPEPSRTESPSAFPLSEMALQQIAVTAAIILMMFMILKGKQFSK